MRKPSLFPTAVILSASEGSRKLKRFFASLRMTKNSGFFLLLTAFCFLISAPAAYAVCSAPAGIAGEFEYDATDDRYEYCDGTNWISTGTSTASGLVGHWKLDETGSTTTAVDAVNSHNGTLTNMDPVNDWKATGGTIYGALDFEGTAGSNDDRVRVTNHADIDADNFTGLTAAAWIYPRTGGESGDGRIIDKADGGSATHDGWRFTITDVGINNRVRFIAEHATTDLDRITSETVSLNQWNHVAVTWDKSTTATNVHIYINGVEATYITATNGVGSFTDTRDLYIGNDAGTFRGFDGLIDDARLYDRVLSAAEVSLLHQIGGSSCTKQGEMQYDSTNNVYKYCDGAKEVLMGPAPGAGGAGCSTPTGKPGTMLYNSTTNTMQYCDGTDWINVD